METSGKFLVYHDGQRTFGYRIMDNPAHPESFAILVSRPQCWALEKKGSDFSGLVASKNT